MNAFLKSLLPLACAWAEKQESIILRDGVELPATFLEPGRRLGIAHPERVRLRAVEQIPMPVDPVLRSVGERIGLISGRTAGMTLRYGIYIRSDCWGERRLLIHELAHVAQYERLGGFRPFLEQYLAECISPGYPFGALEQEAKVAEVEICGEGDGDGKRE